MRRCVGFAKGWAYGSLTVVNLFALRATNPAALYDHADPVGPVNDVVIELWCEAAEFAVAAWGVHGTHRDCDEAVQQVFASIGQPLYHPGLTMGGHPRHPLHLPAGVRPTLFLG